MSSRRPTSWGSTWTIACSVARFTLASRTPWVRLRKRSIRLTHEAQVIPWTSRMMSIGAGSGVMAGADTLGPGGDPARCRILPWSISAAAGRPDRGGPDRASWRRRPHRPEPQGPTSVSLIHAYHAALCLDGTREQSGAGCWVPGPRAGLGLAPWRGAGDKAPG